MNEFKRLAIIGLVGLAATTSSFAMFPVIDPAAIAQLVKSLIQLRQSYQVAVNTFQQAKFNMTHFGSAAKQTWQGWQAQILQSRVPNQFGENANYDQAINTGRNTTAAWNITSQPLQPAASYSNLPPNSPELSEMAVAERYQGYGPNALAIIGQMRVDGLKNQQALAQLQSTFSNNPNDTEGQQLNTLNGSNLLLANSVQQQNVLLASMAESQTIHAKLEQDQLIAHFNMLAHAETMKQTTPTEVIMDDASVNAWRLK